MSYLALARKWRPRRFTDVMGQGPVIQALAHALDQDRLHPAVLLTGTRGVGKTTIARIIAKGLNCETGVSSQPCGICSSCREIDEGRSVDMLEIDAASHTGVDNIREIIENSRYAPARSRYKVYLIDEVHMLSKGAFNALLKTLEEPPPHVKFVLATTDPQKLPITVLSRCLQFGLRRLPVALIREQLSRIADAEQISAEVGALLVLARAADGSMRDGLSLMDQAIAFAGGQALAAEAVETMLGQVSRGALWPILQAVFLDDRADLAARLNLLAECAPDYAALIDELAIALQRLAMIQLLPDTRCDEDDPALVALLDHVSPEALQLHYQFALHGRRDLSAAPEPRLAFEMVILRMLAFRSDDPRGQHPPALSRPTTTANAPSARRATAVAPAPQVVAATEHRSWADQIDQLGLDGFSKGLARNCAVRADDGQRVLLALEPKTRHLLSEERRVAIEQALGAARGVPVVLIIEISSETVADCPIQLEATAEAAQQAATEHGLSTDPTVLALQQQFGAQLRPGSIRPAQNSPPT